MLVSECNIEDLNWLWELEKQHRLLDQQILGEVLNDFYNYWFTQEDKQEYIWDLKDMLLRSDRKILIIKNREEIIWFIIWEIKNLFKSNKWHIAELFISEQYRSKWIGKILIDEITTWFKENNIKYINLWVLYNNKRAISFYTNLWFNEFSLKMTKKI